MSRQVQKLWAVLMAILMAATGCHPQHPHYFFSDGDLSHYLDAATQVEYPDVEQMSIDEVKGTHEPLTLENADQFQFWDVCLQEVVQHTLANSQVIRQLGGRLSGTSQVDRSTAVTPDTLLSVPGQSNTVFDPAITESGPARGLPGVEQALSEFDAQLTSSIFWEKNDRPQNFTPGVGPLFPQIFRQDLNRFTTEINKFSASGAIFAFRNNTIYDLNNTGSRVFPSDWETNFEAEFRQPLLQGAGAQYNRIAGPFSPQTGRGSRTFDGVVLARINTDITLADFEANIRNLIKDTEDSYWRLYFNYRNLDARKTARDSALQTWKRVKTLAEEQARGGEADKEARARAEYFFRRAEVESALNELFRTENQLRYLMGLAMSDGRLIRPIDEPTTARVTFDWNQIHCEALARSVELRRQKWVIKQQELKLIAARNHLLPRLDAVGRYRWLGLGDDLIGDPQGGSFLDDDSTAFENLTSGDFQEWQLGLVFTMPIGFRGELSEVRHHQLQVARERAILAEQELELSNLLGDAVRSLVNNYTQMQTNFNRRVAAVREVDAMQAAYEVGTVTLDLLLDAQRRLADAETAYYASLADYNRSIINVHFQKGSLLEYNEVYLAEGPWPKKAYFDALRQARKRDASTYLDYGFTRPKVFSRGPYLQHGDHSGHLDGTMLPNEAPAEEIPTPLPANDADSAAEPLTVPAARPAPGPQLQAPGSGWAGQPVPSGAAQANVAQPAGGRGPSQANSSAEIGIGEDAANRGGVDWISPTADGNYPDLSLSSQDEPIANHSLDSASEAAAGWKRAQRPLAGPGLRR